MNKIGKIAAELGLDLGSLTISECVMVAEKAGVSIGEVILTEAEQKSGLSRQEVEKKVLDSFSHNLSAVEAGCTTGSSFLMGKIGQQMTSGNLPKIFEDRCSKNHWPTHWPHRSATIPWGSSPARERVTPALIPGW